MTDEERAKHMSELPKLCSRWFKRWEALLTAQKFLAGSKVSVSDSAALRCVLDFVELLSEEALQAEYPRLHAWKIEMMAIPPIKQYLDKRAPIIKSLSMARPYIAAVETVLDKKLF